MNLDFNTFYAERVMRLNIPDEGLDEYINRAKASSKRYGNTPGTIPRSSLNSGIAKGYFFIHPTIHRNHGCPTGLRDPLIYIKTKNISHILCVLVLCLKVIMRGKYAYKRYVYALMGT